ncbi:MAG TPA: cohesin domain-containing protein [Verrucomicrobiae bacterium]|nr:cohesin domain-containing protein [Verrucomicrobiae bacterium]
MMKPVVSAAIAIAALLLFIPISCSADAILSVSGPATVSPGDTFTVDVVVTGATDLYTVGLDLDFDPSVLEATSVSEGPLLPMGGPTSFIPGDIDNVGGTVTFNGDSLYGVPSGVSSDGTLFVFTFTAIGDGTSPITIVSGTEYLIDSQGDILGDTIDNGSVTVQTQASSSNVPEPSSLPLLFLGVTSLAALFAGRKYTRDAIAPA